MIAFIVLSVLVLIVLFYMSKSSKCPCGCGCAEGRCDCKGCTCKKCKEKWTVYGADWCGWTRKQLDYMKKNGKAFDFVDCEKKQCNGIESFPTLKSSNGETFSGYREV
jgi:hypothetical protein